MVLIEGNVVDMKKVDICFVVLHYIAIDYTQKCIESIKNNIDTELYKIIVIDNASPNNSIKELINMYQKDSKIIIKGSKENLGFAKGNNLGINIAKEYKPKFIAVLNNDIILLEKQLYNKLEEDYLETNFAVLGPMIYTADGRCDINPIGTNKRTKEWIEGFLRHNKRLLFLSKFNLDIIFQQLLRVYYSFRKKENKNLKDFIYKKTNVELHGCFLVFSDMYFKYFDGFEPRTFMYFEEVILYHSLLNNNLISLYDPYIGVYHAEEAATKVSFSTDLNRRKNRYRYSIESMELLLKEYM